jgi:transcriptional regulator with GAF, ATPase, and Fis domain
VTPAPAVDDLLASVAALSSSTEEAFDPRRFLERFSERIQPLLPHDRVVIFRRSEDEETFTAFAEHDLRGVDLYDGFWTTLFDPEARFRIGEWPHLAPAFDGQEVLIDDGQKVSDPGPFERRVVETGVRSMLVVPLRSRDAVVAVLGVASRAPARYGPVHRAALHQLAALIAPTIENTFLLQRDRRRRDRMNVLHQLAQELGSSLDLRGIFGRLGEIVRPVLDFDVMGVTVVGQSGRELELLAVSDEHHRCAEDPNRHIALDSLSFAPRVAAGESVLIRNAPVELDPSMAGDRQIIETGARSSICVPLFFGERFGGVLHFCKQREYWYDSADVELGNQIAVHVVIAIQHQHLAEEQKRVAVAETRARRLEARVQTLRRELEDRYGFDRIIGRSPALRDTLERAAKVAPTGTTVLISGESGTGKELVARAIHYSSPRAEAPFVAINCAALPESLLESELFGHEKGAFTGADRQKLGRFDLAAGGTLFLDEVGELAPGVQAKLLRVIQEQEFQRIGGTATIRADVRLVTATNRDLERSVEKGDFRRDLFYRLNVFTIQLPPLRERGDDVLLLADHFVHDLEARMGKSVPGISREARDALLGYPWPGNIRELQNAIERALILSDGGLLGVAQLGLDLTKRAASAESPAPLAVLEGGGADAPRGTLPDWERRLVIEALQKANGNKSSAAALLGLTRSQLYTRLKRFGLDSAAAQPSTESSRSQRS